MVGKLQKQTCWNVILLFRNFCFKNKIINSSCVQSAAIISGQECITLNDAKLVIRRQHKQYVFVAGTRIAISMQFDKWAENWLPPNFGWESFQPDQLPESAWYKAAVSQVPKQRRSCQYTTGSSFQQRSKFRSV